MQQATNNSRARLKSAELLSTTGALVLGVGLGAALSTYIGSVAVLLLVAGIASHGFGMLQKHRLEAKQGYAPAWWEAALYWGCWLKGGYTPDTIVVRHGKPVRLNFRREETASCSDKVIFADFNKSADLPTGETVAVELLPKEPGEFPFACPMGMFRGRLVVE